MLFTLQVCANNAECENTEGSFQCNCREGFKKASNGESCIGKSNLVYITSIIQSLSFCS